MNMRLFSWDGIAAGGGKDFSSWIQAEADGAPVFSALTVGDFDGCHAGHQALFRRVLAAAYSARQTENPGICLPGVVTFRRSASSPGKKHGGSISTLRQRLSFLENLGFAFVLLIDFSADFSKMKGYDFLRVLSGPLRMRYLAVGEDFRCGFRLDTGRREIRTAASRLGFAFDALPGVFLDGARVSSTAVRHAVLSADFTGAERLLGHPFVLDISGIAWRSASGSSGGQVLYAPAEAFAQILPPAGRYRARLYAGDEIQTPDFICSLDGKTVFLECGENLLRIREKLSGSGAGESGAFSDGLGFAATTD